MSTLQKPTNSCFVTCLLRFDLAMSRYVAILFPCLLVNIACFFFSPSNHHAFGLGDLTQSHYSPEISNAARLAAELLKSNELGRRHGWPDARPGLVAPNGPRNQSEIQCKEMQRTTIVRICQDVADTISKFADFLNFIKSVGCAQGEALPGKLAWCPTVPNITYNSTRKGGGLGCAIKPPSRG